MFLFTQIQLHDYPSVFGVAEVLFAIYRQKIFLTRIQRCRKPFHSLSISGSPDKLLLTKLPELFGSVRQTDSTAAGQIGHAPRVREVRGKTVNGRLWNSGSSGSTAIPKPDATSPAMTASSSVSIATVGAAWIWLKSASTFLRRPEQDAKQICGYGRVSCNATLCLLLSGCPKGVITTKGFR